MDLLSTSMTLPNFLPSSFPTSSFMCSKGTPQTWTQKGVWVKFIFVEDSPCLHRVKRMRLLSKFQGLFLSTQFSWYMELNLNWSILFPTSTIRTSDPIFHAALRVLLSALMFWCLSDSRRPNRLRVHSSISSGLLHLDIEISSSSTFVNCSFFKFSTTSCSMERKENTNPLPRDSWRSF